MLKSVSDPCNISHITLPPQGHCQKTTAVVATEPVVLPCTEVKSSNQGTLMLGPLPATSDHVTIIDSSEKNVQNKRSKVQGVGPTST